MKMICSLIAQDAIENGIRKFVIFRWEGGKWPGGNDYSFKIPQ